MQSPADLVRIEFQSPLGVELTLRHVDDQTLTFDVWTHPAQRGQGLATRALRDLARLCDTHGVTLRIQVDPSAEIMSAMDLRRWYERHGFEVEGNWRSRRMRREPHARPDPDQ